MIRAIPFYQELIGRGTTNEILLYGLIENLSFREGYCFASSEYMAEQLGLAKGTISNLLSAIAKKGWVEVELDNDNHRVSVSPKLGIKIPPKKRKKAVENHVEKSVEKAAFASRYNEGPLHATMKAPSRYNEATNGGDNGGRNIKYNNKVIIKEINKEKNKFIPYPKRKDFDSDAEFEKAFYAMNTKKLDLGAF